jgi:hypothetical protein
MGWKRRKSFRATGWLPRAEQGVDAVLMGATVPLDPAQELVMPDDDIRRYDMRCRYARATVTIELEDIPPPEDTDE